MDHERQARKAVTRSGGVTYYNATGRPITAMMEIGGASGGTVQSIFVAGENILGTDAFAALSGSRMFFTFPIPAGASYSYDVTAGFGTISKELR